jgi:hypothetical protein
MGGSTTAWSPRRSWKPGLRSLPNENRARLATRLGTNEISIRRGSTARSRTRQRCWRSSIRTPGRSQSGRGKHPNRLPTGLPRRSHRETLSLPSGVPLSLPVGAPMGLPFGRDRLPTAVQIVSRRGPKRREGKGREEKGRDSRIIVIRQHQAPRARARGRRRRSSSKTERSGQWPDRFKLQERKPNS